MGTDYSMKIPIDKIIGSLIGITTVLIPNFAYWSADCSGLFGNSPLVGLMVFTGCGGCFTFLFLAEKGKRVLALLPGIVAGLGGSCMTYIAAKQLGPHPLQVRLICTTVLLGAMPGYYLAVFLREKKGSVRAFEQNS